MKLRMDVLKSNIGSKSVELVKFIRKEIEEISFVITVDMDYRMVMKPAYGSLYSTSVIDTVTKEVKDFGFGEYFPAVSVKDSEVFLKVERNLLNLFGGKMFDTWVEQQVLRTKGRKKLADLICKYNPDLNHDGVLSMLNKKRTGEVNFILLPTLLKPVKVAFCNCEIMDYETLSVE